MKSGIKSLASLQTGEKGLVKGVECANRELRNKLLTMGIVEGAEVEVARIAPIGDPINIKVLGFMLALRLSEAEHIRIALA